MNNMIRPPYPDRYDINHKVITLCMLSAYLFLCACHTGINSTSPSSTNAASAPTTILTTSSPITSTSITTPTSTSRTPSQLQSAIGWYTGSTGHVDDVRARLLLEQSAQGQDALSIMWLARVYSTGRMTFPRDPGKAREIAAGVIQKIEQLAHADNTEAVFLMGTAYAEGLGKDIDPILAAQWYQRAARVGHMLAQHNLGNIYASGSGIEQDDSQAVFWWLKAAHAGDAIPQYRLGIMYEKGRGVDQDINEAIRWYADAASRGNGPARIALARLTQ